VTHAETKPRTADEWASRAITAEAKLTLANAEIERLTRYHDSAQSALAAGAAEKDRLLGQQRMFRKKLTSVLSTIQTLLDESDP
jgi:hypothetical protein